MSETIKYGVATNFDGEEKIFNNFCHIYPHSEYSEYNETKNIFEVKIKPFNAVNGRWTDINYYCTKNIYARFKSYKHESSAIKVIEKKKAELVKRLNNDKLYFNFDDVNTNQYYSKIKGSIYAETPEKINAVIQTSKKIALAQVESIFKNVYPKKITIGGRDIAFGGAYGVKIYQKKRVNSDKCASCGLLFDGVMPYLRTAGSSTCICLECSRKLVEQMIAIDLPEGYLADYKKKLMIYRMESK